MKKYLKLIVLALFMGGLVSLWATLNAQAQINFFTFFIPYPADKLDDQFDAQRTDFDLIDDPISTTISISINRDNTLVFYDHWEDGLEQNLTTPMRGTTQVWGDNDVSNGIPPEFTTDILQAGDVIVLQNQVDLPRNPAVIRFDGGDKLIAENGPIAVTLAVWPIDNDGEIVTDPDDPPRPGILYAGAWELYPTIKWGREYRIPIGEDENPRRIFDVVGLNIQAVNDNTQVTIDIDNDGAPEDTVVLNRGESFTKIDGVEVGTHIKATNPVQVHVFTANPEQQYEARAYTIVPFDQWSNQLIAPRSSDGDFWLHNPHPFPIIVTARSVSTTVPINIAPNTTVKYPPTGLSGPTGMLFSTPLVTHTFYGLAALDRRRFQDWGYSLLPVDATTTQALIGLGIGNNLNPPRPDPTIPNSTGYESPVYVTALTKTQIFLDYNGDGQADQPAIDVNPLEEVRITKPPTAPHPYDLTGTYLFTKDGTRFLAVWGQDELAPIENPSIDVGTSIVPLPSLIIHKTIKQVFTDIDCSGSITLDDVVQYQLQYFNTGVTPIENVLVADDFQVNELGYVPDSTMLNDAPISDNQGNDTPFPLDEAGYIIGRLEERETGVLTFNAQVEKTAVVTNQAIISTTDAAARADLSILVTEIEDIIDPIYEIETAPLDPADGLIAPGETITLSVAVTNTTNRPISSFPLHYDFDEAYLTFDSAQPPPTLTTPGAIIWNLVEILNGDLLPGEPVHLTVRFKAAEMIPQQVVSTTIHAAGDRGRLNDGANLPICRDETNITFATLPPPTATPPTETPSTETPPPITVTPPPDTTPVPTPGDPGGNDNDGDDDDDDDDNGGDSGGNGDGGDRSPSQTPTSSGNLPPEGEGTSIARASSETSTLPVAFLPETGLDRPAAQFSWPLIIVSCVGLGCLWIIYWRRRD